MQEVANAVNITEKTLSDYEAGARMPRDEVKIRLANYYGVDTESIFFQEGGVESGKNQL